jgi:hypothetical protein
MSLHIFKENPSLLTILNTRMKSDERHKFICLYIYINDYIIFVLLLYDKNLTRKPQGKRPRRRNRHRWQDNTGMDLWKIGWEGVD